MKILQLTAPAEVGGLETVVLDLCAGLGARGLQVVLGAVLEPGSASEAMPVRAESLGLDVRRVVVPHRSYLREYRALARLIAAEAPDVVHTHGYRADLIGGRAARRNGVPWVSTAHGFTGVTPRGRLYEWLQIRALRRADAAVAVSRPVGERLAAAGVRQDRIAHLTNAWVRRPLLERAAARQRLQLPADGHVVGWVGRLTHEKGADLFLVAMAQLVGLPWTVSIVGDGPDRAALESRARTLGIAERIRWHGVVPGAAALYRAFDTWVLSSRTEGTPIALFEAMAARVPVVATAVGGVPDVVTDREAHLVPPGDPAALAAAIGGVLTEPAAEAARLDAAEARIASAFSAEAWLDSHLSLYGRVRDKQQ